MPTTIETRANTLARRKQIADADVEKLSNMALKDNKITPAEAKALGKVAGLPDDRFVKTGNDVSSAVSDLRDAAVTAQDLLGAKLSVKSTIPGLTVSFDKAVTVTPDDGYGASYARYLNVQMKGNKASKDGVLAFDYGAFSVSVNVKKGMDAQTVFNRVESRVAAQQNGALSVRGGEFGPRTLNASVGFGIHRSTHTTKLEAMEIQRNLTWADLVEAQQEGAPDAITAPIQKTLAEMDKAIEKEKASTKTGD